MRNQNQSSTDPSSSGARPGERGGAHVRVIAVTSGKGGVGKSNVAANLGLLLAGAGLRVLVIDTDLGLANVDILLGIHPNRTMQDVIDGKAEIHEVLTPGPLGIEALAAPSPESGYVELDATQQLNFINAVDHLHQQFDYILIDTGAGISRTVRYFTSASHEIVVVVSPEPTSITDAYALMKVLSIEHGERRFRLLVNSVEKRGQGRSVYRKLLGVANQYLDIRLEFLGELPADDAVRSAVLRGQPVAVGDPKSPFVQALGGVAERLRSTPPQRLVKSNLHFFSQQLVRSQ